MNQYGHGNTQVDNLAALPGSVQNFGLQELLIGPEWTWNPNVAKPDDLQELLIPKMPAPLGEVRQAGEMVKVYGPE